jgi:putative tryptophan/tyrosine transport system substrate-binding protein
MKMIFSEALTPTPALLRNVRKEGSYLARAVFFSFTLVCASSVASAQSRTLPKIGEIWGTANAEASAPYVQPFMARMRELGWIDGKTAQFIVRYYAPDKGDVSTVVRELVGQKVDVLVLSDFACASAREVTTTIPIVCADMYDPILEGASTSLARPSANMTGVSWQSIETAAKRVELAKDLLPNLKRAALIFDASDRGAMIESKGFAQGAAKVGAKLDAFGLREPRDLEAAFAALRKSHPDVLLVAVSPRTITNLDRIMAFAAEIRVPTVSEIGEFARSGVLLTYGVNIDETYMRAADLTHRILKGTKPRDLPFEQPTKFDLVVNLKTAKALGIKIPESIMLRATEVIR